MDQFIFCEVIVEQMTFLEEETIMLSVLNAAVNIYYSCGCVIIDTLSTGEYEIKSGCVWDYPSAHTHVSAVACVRAIQKQF